jgi:hypothetical protein
MQVAVHNNRTVFGKNLRLEREVCDAITFIALTIFQAEISQGKRIGVHIHKHYRGPKRITSCGFAVITPYDRRVKIRCSVKVPFHKGIMVLIATMIVEDDAGQTTTGYHISKRIQQFNDSGKRIDTTHRRVFTLPGATVETATRVPDEIEVETHTDSADKTHASDTCVQTAVDALHTLWKRPESINPNGNWKWSSMTQAEIMQMISAGVTECEEEACAEIFTTLLRDGHLNYAPGRQGPERKYLLPSEIRYRLEAELPTPSSRSDSTERPTVEHGMPVVYASSSRQAIVVEQIKLHVQLTEIEARLRESLVDMKERVARTDALLEEVQRALNDLPPLPELVKRL